MIRPTAVYLDYTDAHSARAWRWLSLLGRRHALEVRPFWNGGGTVSPWERTHTDAGLELAALGELAREQGRRQHHAFVDAALALVGDRRADLGDPEAWLALAQRTGIDLGRFAADSERWRAEVGLWHREGQDRFGVRQAPTVLLDERRALELRLRRSVPDPKEARRLLDEVNGLLRVGSGSGA